MRQERSYYDDRGLSVCAYDFIEDALIASGMSVCCGDVAFYRALADRVSGPVLDVGTGTGRIAWALAQAGHAVLGVDLSPAMLREAERKRGEHPEAVGARVRFVPGDMTDLDLGGTFPLVISAYYGLNHLLEPERQRAALLSLRRHLAPGGLLVLHAMEPTEGLLIRNDTGPKSKRLRVGNPSAGQMVEWAILERRADSAAQRIAHVVQYRIFGAGGSVLAESRETLTYRWGTQQELRYLFELCGLAVEALHGDFHGGKPGAGKEQIWLLRHADTGAAGGSVGNPPSAR